VPDKFMTISEILNAAPLTLSFEFFPPKTEAGETLLTAAVKRLAAVNPSFISVTYGAGGSTQNKSLQICGALTRQAAFPVMAHLTGICHTRDEVAEITDAFWDAGLRNIMALRGDRPRNAPDWAPIEGGFTYAKDLIAFLKSQHSFCIGGACYPEGHTETPDISLGVQHAREKVDAGAEFLVTQMFFENARYFDFVESLRAAGVTVPVIPGIMPVTGFAQIERFETQFGACLPAELREKLLTYEGDEIAVGKVGLEWSVQQCQALLDGGAPGIHFYTLNKSKATVQVCEQLDLTRRPSSVEVS